MYQLRETSKKELAIRDKGGFICFFPKITRYQDQPERYIEETTEQLETARYLEFALNNKKNIIGAIEQAIKALDMDDRFGNDIDRRHEEEEQAYAQLNHIKTLFDANFTNKRDQ